MDDPIINVPIPSSIVASLQAIFGQPTVIASLEEELQLAQLELDSITKEIERRKNLPERSPQFNDSRTKSTMMPEGFFSPLNSSNKSAYISEAQYLYETTIFRMQRAKASIAQYKEMNP
jgi:hypothetical protein